MASDQTTVNSSAEILAEVLRDAGWTCIPPVDPNDLIPEPAVGQVWRSPKPRVEPRTVVSVGPHRTYPWAGDKCVGFTTPSRPPSEWGPATLNPNAWDSWVRKSDARPV